MPDPLIETPVAPSEKEKEKVLKSFRASRIMIPVLLGLAVAVWFFLREFDPDQFKAIQWSSHAFFWIGMAVLLLVIRHLFYAFRLRSITAGALSWRKCIELIVIWEFSAALTPTSKGGPIVMLFVLTQEKLSAGRTAAAVFYTMVCDAGFFILSMPVLLAIYGPPMLFPGTQTLRDGGDTGAAAVAFFATYAAMLVYWIIMVFLLLVKPHYAERALGWLARRRILRRWAPKIQRLGDEFAHAADEIKAQRWQYHLKVITGTIGAWTSKFLMINCLLIAIVPSTPFDGHTQAFIYARMVAMFIIMTFSPTPGGAGIAELMMTHYISDYAPESIAFVVAMLWRGLAYYGYLLLGGIVTPAWIAARVRQKNAA
ncbi:MAG: flippase-like domain-containing protein [Saprospiraceae bacterium]|nr:flippase-like domain-containing protein [Saprospiraceae bacterium]